MKKLFITVLIAVSAVLSSCTENQSAKKFGGEGTIELAPNETLLNVTWKKDDLWLLIENKNTGEKYFREKSSFGILEGRLNFVTKESKK